MTAKPHGKPAWGYLPADIRKDLNTKYWQNRNRLKRLLNGSIAFPLNIPLKPPRGNAALDNIVHFQHFVAAWQQFSTTQDMKRSNLHRGCEVKWARRTFRSIAEQDIPTQLSIADIGSLAALLGVAQERQLQAWQDKIAYLINALSAVLDRQTDEAKKSACGHALFLALIAHLETLDEFNDSDLSLLAKLIPQLRPGMGAGCYLRALPVTFVDTKFIERNLAIIESITAALIDETAKEIGLLAWLDCKGKPKDWLLIKPLCAQTSALLGGVTLLRLSSDTLLDFELPANNILVIENEQSCLALDNIADTIAVSGGGKNLTWMKAQWLTEKHVGYWGDIDSEGFSILSDARRKLSSITPLMMDSITIETYQARMVGEPASVSKAPIALTERELDLFHKLRAGYYANTRLEQERLPLDYVIKNLTAWAH